MTTALVVLVVLLLLFISFKYVERKRFHQSVEIERISIHDLKQLMEQGREPVLVDARSATAQMLEPSVPGAVLFNGGDPLTALAAFGKDQHIVVYCSCPNDVTAAHVAKQLLAHGYHRAKPLHGGLEAWNTAFAAERPAPAEALGYSPARACIGGALSQIENTLALVQLLRRFTPEHVGPQPAKIHATVTLCPKGGLPFKIRALS